MKRYIAIGLLLMGGVATAATSDEQRADDEAQIRSLVKQLYVAGNNPNSSADTYLYTYFLPTSLKPLQVVSGPNGERKKWDKILKSFDRNNERFQAYLEMLSNAENAPIKFYTSRQGEPIAVIDVTFPRKPKFTKYQGKWYASM
ncbi:hypothetical protein LRP49_01775 [Enterovibrio sp. ZSDZ35]|uniref:Uncharacterized protein n=1 Tax=Enterovibrio qingdaonensis TaxID=2899818 RepID=A0ABT5QGD3_9GAMM|nr:hypothetical protein [Enterovibrio sp. ZSDZ35]MDD1779914.1 hypothetical protein [Enterovibrio sp. ZSDZ35]